MYLNQNSQDIHIFKLNHQFLIGVSAQNNQQISNGKPKTKISQMGKLLIRQNLISTPKNNHTESQNCKTAKASKLE